jgi:hypothetical protein
MRTLTLRRVAASCFLAAVVFVGLGHSAPAWTVTYEYRTDQAKYTVAPGGTAPVNVFLRETFAPGDPTFLDTEGLLTAGVRVHFDVPTVPTDPAEVLTTADIAINPAFNGPTFSDVVAGSSAGFFGAVDFFSPTVTTPTGPGFNEILLGTFTFTAGLVPGEVTNLLATDFDTSTDETLTGNSFLVLDPLIADATATITVVTPEPSTQVLGVAGLMTVLVIIRARLSALFHWSIVNTNPGSVRGSASMGNVGLRGWSTQLFNRR